ncbi:uncharacterized protein LOC119744558 [Patiria miniata]|uniref:Uncharacterized protein n=1 Tax=Patiria miniata TaxID=46514 RepID=A0A914BKZ5_PATMI|nr:uncharacterized protein LOC119744558 [Patiria miniata]
MILCAGSLPTTTSETATDTPTNVFTSEYSSFNPSTNVDTTPLPTTNPLPTTAFTGVGTATVAGTTTDTTALYTTTDAVTTTICPLFPVIIPCITLVVFLILVCIINICRTRRKPNPQTKKGDVEFLLYPPRHSTKNRYKLRFNKKTGPPYRAPADDRLPAHINPAFENEYGGDPADPVGESPPVCLGGILIISGDETRESGSATGEASPKDQEATHVIKGQSVGKGDDAREKDSRK